VPSAALGWEDVGARVGFVQVVALGQPATENVHHSDCHRADDSDDGDAGKRVCIRPAQAARMMVAAGLLRPAVAESAPHASMRRTEAGPPGAGFRPLTPAPAARLMSPPAVVAERAYPLEPTPACGVSSHCAGKAPGRLRTGTAARGGTPPTSLRPVEGTVIIVNARAACQGGRWSDAAARVGLRFPWACLRTEWPRQVRSDLALSSAKLASTAGPRPLYASGLRKQAPARAIGGFADRCRRDRQTASGKTDHAFTIPG